MYVIFINNRFQSSLRKCETEDRVGYPVCVEVSPSSDRYRKNLDALAVHIEDTQSTQLAAAATKQTSGTKEKLVIDMAKLHRKMAVLLHHFRTKNNVHVDTVLCTSQQTPPRRQRHQ